MIFSSSLLAASCFPCITSMKKFKCSYDPVHNPEQTYADSVLNNGLFIFFFALGSLVTRYRQKHEKFQFKAVYCFFVTILETLCAIVIYFSTIHGYYNDDCKTAKENTPNVLLSFGWVAIWVLGFLHGVIIAYFTTVIPRFDIIPHN